MKTTKWILDPMHSELGFKIKHMMISNVSGSFNNFSAELETIEDDFSRPQIDLKAEVGSITTNNKDRDAHLLNSDFFDVEKYPELRFTSSKIEKIDEDNFFLYGILKMKGVEKEVKLNMEYNGSATDMHGDKKAGFSVNGKINRNDWGLSFNGPLKTGGMILGDEVKIAGEVQFVRQQIKTPA